MKQRNILNKVLLVFCMFIITLFPNVLDAAGEDYSAGFRIYKYGSKYESMKEDISKYNISNRAQRNAYIKAYREKGPNAWFEDYKNGSVEEITSATSLKPGDTFVVGTSLTTLNESYNANQFALFYRYNSDLIEVLTVTPESNVETIVIDTQTVSTIFDSRVQWPDNGVFPSDTWGTDVFNIDTPGMVSITIRDKSTSDIAYFDYEDNMAFAYVVFKVKDTATSGAAIDFDYIYEAGTETLGSDELGNSRTVERNNLHILSVAQAALSDDTTLSALSVKNGTTEYVLTPAFVAGSTTDTYSTVVPSSVSTVDIQATMTVPGSIAISGLGNKSLNVGDNTFTFTATAANGDIKIYTINVKRLDNDTKLETLTLSGITFTFNPNTNSYDLTAPYKTTSTTVSATLPAGSKATIDSGTGSWNLTTVGGVNTRKVVVKAEDCEYTTAQVPGVTCTTGEYTLNVTRSNPSSDATLSALNVDGTLVTGFNSNTLTYTLTPVGKNKTSINITATATDSNATVSGTGSKTLTAGTDHSFDIVVTAEDGTTKKTYTINVRKKSDNTTLSTLSVSNGGNNYILTPTFVSGSTTDTYSTVVPNSVNSVDIQATMTVPGSILSTELGTKTVNVGNNTFTFTATAEDGETTKTYTINVKRLDNDTKLSTLTLSGITFTFNPNTNSYDLTAPYKTTSTTVSATLPAGSKATIDSGTGSWNLTTIGGVNTRKVVVKAEDCGYTTTQVPEVICTTGEYILNVTRSNPSSDATLSALNVDGALVTGFDPTTEEYTLTPVGSSKTSINITATSTDSNATVSGTGSKTLSTGDNSFDVVVTAEDGITTKTYTIKVRQKSGDASLSSLTVTSSPQGTLNPSTFLPTTYSYNYSYDSSVTSINVQATAAGSGRVISGTGTFTPGVDARTTVVVESEDGNTQDYIVNFVRSLSDDRNLGTLTVTYDGSDHPVTPTVSDGVTEYSIEIPHEVSSVTVNATAKSNYSRVTSGTGVVNNIAFTPVNRTIVVTSEANLTQDYTLTIIRKKSDNANLTGITVDGVSISAFDKDTLNYTLPDVNGNVSKLTIGYTKENQYSDVVVTGDTLADGDNQIKLTVTSQDESKTKVYTLNVKRKSSVANLQSLTVSSSPQGTMTPTVFVPGTVTYTYTYDSSVTSIDITASAAGNATIVSGTGSYDPTTASKAEIVVEAEDGTQKTYTVNFSRLLSSDVRLGTLTVTYDGSDHPVTPTVSDGVKQYNITIPHEVSSVTVNATAKNNYSRVTSGTGLVSNIAFTPVNRSIVVTAENNDRETYVLTITREKSDDAKLSAINLDGTLLTGFNPELLTYTLLPVDSTVSSLNLTYSKSNQYSTASIVAGTNNLKDGNNTVIIRVVSQDGSNTNDYEIHVKRKSSDTTLSGLTITSTPQGSYTPSFNPSTKEYTYKYDRTVSSVVVNATATSGTVTDGNGTYTLPDTKEVTIEVTAEDENIKDTYKIKFEQILESDSSLKTLNLKHGSDNFTLTPAFAPSRINYTLTVEGDVDEIEIEAEPNGEYTKSVTGTGTTALVSGSNTKEVVVTAEDGTSTTYTITITRKINTSATVTEITIGGEAIETPFDPTKASYDLGTVPYDTTTIDIGATPTPGATLSGDTGVQNLAVGDNTFEINVTAQDGVTTGKYTIKVRRQSNDYSLSNLIVTSSPASTVKKDVNGDFTIDVPSGVTTISINPVTTHANATVTNASSLNNIDITNITYIDVDVMAEDNLYYGTHRIKINKLLSSNVYLSSLTVDQGTLSPTFDKDTDSYTVNVGTDVDSITLTAVAEDAKAQVSGDGVKSLNPGSNTFVITVTAEDSSSKDYTVVVTREQKSILTLSDLTIDGITIDDFSPSKTSYTITVPYSKADITIAATPTDSDANVTGDGIGTHNLTQNSETFSFIVTAQDGSTQTYEITVNKEAADTDNTLSDLSVDGYTLSPTFDPSEENYNIGNVSDTEDSLKVNVTPSSGKSNVIYKVNGFDATPDENGKLSIPSDLGPGTVEVIVEAEDGTKKTYTIRYNKTDGSDTGLDKIVSVKMADGLTDMHDIDDDYVLTGRPQVSWSTFKTEFLNEQSELYLYNNDGVTESTAQFVRTGDMIKLIRNGEVLDTKYVVIKADINGDGLITVADASAIISHDLELKAIEGPYYRAAWVNNDTLVTVADASAIISHDLELIFITWGKASN